MILPNSNLKSSTCLALYFCSSCAMLVMSFLNFSSNLYALSKPGAHDSFRRVTQQRNSLFFLVMAFFCFPKHKAIQRNKLLFRFHRERYSEMVWEKIPIQGNSFWFLVYKFLTLISIHLKEANEKLRTGTGVYIEQLVSALSFVLEVPSSILSDSNVCSDFSLICVAVALNTRKMEHWQREGIKGVQSASIANSSMNWRN